MEGLSVKTIKLKIEIFEKAMDKVVPGNKHANFRLMIRKFLKGILWCFHTRARQRQDNDKTNVEPVHSYDAFHTRSGMSGVKGIIGMHRFNICLVVVLSLSCRCLPLVWKHY